MMLVHFCFYLVFSDCKNKNSGHTTFQKLLTFVNERFQNF